MWIVLTIMHGMHIMKLLIQVRYIPVNIFIDSPGVVYCESTQTVAVLGPSEVFTRAIITPRQRSSS